MDREFGSFIWDSEKEQSNIRKHGIDFITACKGFCDPLRKIFVDSLHGRKEARFFCIGKVEDRILAIRFTYRLNKIRIIGAGYWRKGKRYYEEKDG